MVITISCAGIVKVHKIHFTFRYCSHKSRMREAGAAGSTEMLNPSSLMEGPCRATPAKPDSFDINELQFYFSPLTAVRTIFVMVS